MAITTTIPIRPIAYLIGGFIEGLSISNMWIPSYLSFHTTHVLLIDLLTAYTVFQSPKLMSICKIGRTTQSG